MAVPGELHALIERFDRDLPSYRSAGFNEAQARIDFINPFLGLLGWDVENRQGLPEAYREVVYEDRVKVGGGTKAPDYGFYAGGQRRFFLEAKKPSVDIAGDVAPAVQLRRYAWSARLPLSVLTDFEEFAVYDCSFEPQKEDGPATARTELFTYDRYAEEEVWAQISSLFSRAAVLSGSLEKYAEENRRRRGTRTGWTRMETGRCVNGTPTAATLRRQRRPLPPPTHQNHLRTTARMAAATWTAATSLARRRLRRYSKTILAIRTGWTATTTTGERAYRSDG